MIVRRPMKTRCFEIISGSLTQARALSFKKSQRHEGVDLERALSVVRTGCPIAQRISKRMSFGHWSLFGGGEPIRRRGYSVEEAPRLHVSADGHRNSLTVARVIFGRESSFKMFQFLVSYCLTT